MRAGHDLNYQALAGVLSISGGKQTPNPQLQVADTAAGSYAAAMLMVAAAVERERTGRGRHIDISMSEQLLPLMTTHIRRADAEERDPVRDGELLSGGAPCYRVYRTKDGQQLTLGALEPKFWLSVVEQTWHAAADLAAAAFHGGPDAPQIAARLADVFASRTRSRMGGNLSAGRRLRGTGARLSRGPRASALASPR